MDSSSSIDTGLVQAENKRTTVNAQRVSLVMISHRLIHDYLYLPAQAIDKKEHHCLLNGTD